MDSSNTQIDTTQPCILLTCDNKCSYLQVCPKRRKDIQQFIGGRLQSMPVQKNDITFIAFFDEEGIQKQLMHNELVQKLFNVTLCGNVLFISADII